ncbi:MAG: hypothetical protein GVY14_01565 [Spirochaetes bacterium]|jgi:hypothetical protein|nr:hypothetical protein [Spirochaetota bacterium]
MNRWNTGNPEERNAIIRTTISVVGFVAVSLLVTGCAWNLADDPSAGGALTIDFTRTSGIGTQNLGDFTELTFFVVEADYFRGGGRSVRVGPNGAPEAPARTAPLPEDSPALEEFGQPQPVTAGTAGELISIPGGVARYFDTNSLESVSSVRFDNLDVGQEYVIWIDGDAGVSDLRLGFTTARIRAGADTTVSVNLTADRFPTFLETLYERYVEPFLVPPAPIDLGDFGFYEYEGTGSVTTIIDGEETDAVLNRAIIARFSFDEFDEGFEGSSSYNFFALWFYAEEPADQDVEVFLYILDSNSAVEPKRSAYTLSVIGEESSTLPDAGSIYGVATALLSEERQYYLVGDPQPNLTTAGFSGGGPSSGGRFDFGVSGTFLEDNVEETTVNGEISELTFTFGELLEALDDDYSIPDID